MNKQSRREFFHVTGLGLAAGSLLTACNSQGKGNVSVNTTKDLLLNLGMASYTFRKFGLEETITMTKRLGLSHIAFKSFHLALDSTPKEIKNVAETVKTAGLNLYGAGVIYMKTEQEVNQAFEYTKAAGMKVIIGVPEHNLLDLVNQKVKEYDIIVAIHNHGPGDERYPSPESVYTRVKNLDKRIGLCMDIGHTQRIGVDPSEAAIKYADRLLDVHVKDVTSSTKDGTTVEIGRGVIDIPKFLKTLIKINYTGNVSLEFEKDAEDPLPGAAESIGYLKGVLSVI